MKVYVVNDSVGGLIDSVWLDEASAQKRADELNAPGGVMVEYTVKELIVEDDVTK